MLARVPGDREARLEVGESDVRMEVGDSGPSVDVGEREARTERRGTRDARMLLACVGDREVRGARVVERGSVLDGEMELWVERRGCGGSRMDARVLPLLGGDSTVASAEVEEGEARRERRDWGDAAEGDVARGGEDACAGASEVRMDNRDFCGDSEARGSALTGRRPRSGRGTHG